MNFLEEMKEKHKFTMRRETGEVDTRTVDEQATEIIEDYLIPLAKLDVLFGGSGVLWNTEFHQVKGVWCQGSHSEDDYENFATPFCTEALIAAAEKAEQYGLIGLNRYEEFGYFGFTLLLVDKSETKSTYRYVRYLGDI